MSEMPDTSEVEQLRDRLAAARREIIALRAILKVAGLDGAHGRALLPARQTRGFGMPPGGARDYG